MKIKAKITPKIKQILQKGLFTCCILCGICVLTPMEAEAALTETARLTVEDQTFVEDGKVLKTSLSDGKGGTAVYDAAVNTLTLTNYTFTKLGRNNTFIYANSMTNDQTFRIVLEGTNTMFRAEEDREKGTIEGFCVELRNDAVIEGNGKLITNTAIGGGEVSDSGL